MQNAQVVSRPFHALSNGALVFAANLIHIMYSSTGKWVILFSENVIALNLYFLHLGLNLQEN